MIHQHQHQPKQDDIGKANESARASAKARIAALSRHKQNIHSLVLLLAVQLLLLAARAIPCNAAPIDSSNGNGNGNGNVFAKQGAETPLQQQPECVESGVSFVCDINLQLQETATATTTIVEAQLECPLLVPGAPVNLSAVNPQSCGCLAVVTAEGNAASAAAVPRECSCRLCQGTANRLSIDCSTVATHPFVVGACKHMGCDGICIDPAPPAIASTSGGTNTSTTLAPATPAPAGDTAASNNNNNTSTQPPPTSVTATRPPTNTSTATTASTTAPNPNTTTTTTTTTTTEPSSTKPPSGPGDDTSLNGTSTNSPTTSTTLNTRGTLPWKIPAAFFVSHPKDVSVQQLQVLLQQAFVKFVQTVVVNDVDVATFGNDIIEEEEEDTPVNATSITENDKDNSTSTSTSDSKGRRWLRLRRQVAPLLLQQQQQQQHPNRRRRLDVLFHPTATEIYLLRNADCPSNVPAQSVCEVAYGQFQLLLGPDENPTAVVNQYTLATEQAITNGQLQDELVAMDSQTPLLTIVSAAQPVTPALAANQCRFCPDGSAPLEPDLVVPIPNVPPNELENFNCARIEALYASQSPDGCLNYANTGLTDSFPAPMAEFVRNVLPLDFQVYCQCPQPSSTVGNGAVVIFPSLAETTCPDFCPPNKVIPLENANVMVDESRGLTCADLQQLAHAVHDLSLCLELQRDGAICCTDPPPETPAPAAVPTVPPIADGTVALEILSAFVVYNLDGLNADLILRGPEHGGWSRSYALFVEQVMDELMVGKYNNDDDGNTTTTTGTDDNNDTATAAAQDAAGDAKTEAPATNQSRYFRKRVLQQNNEPEKPEGKLEEKMYLASGAELYQFNDTECPSTVKKTANCSIGYGRYTLYVVNGDPNEEYLHLFEKYTNYTQEAIGRGLLNETVEEVDPLTWLIVEGPADDVFPPLPVEERQITIYDVGGYDEYFMIGIGVSIAIIVLTLVGVLCASDLSGKPDDDSIDPWEKEALKSTHSRRSAKEKAPPVKKSLKDKDGNDLPPKTERQEYEMYRAQLEKLIRQKIPEEYDNIEDLLDIFYQRELILIATLEHMPDCSEHEVEQVSATNNMSTNFNESVDWDGGSFAEDSGDDDSKSDNGVATKSIPELDDEDDESDSDNEDEDGAAVAKEEKEVDEADSNEKKDEEDSEDEADDDSEDEGAREGQEDPLKEEANFRTPNTIHEADDEDDSERPVDDDEAVPEEKKAEEDKDHSSTHDGGEVEEAWDDEDAQDVQDESQSSNKGGGKTDENDEDADSDDEEDAKEASSAPNAAVGESEDESTDRWDDEK